MGSAGRSPDKAIPPLPRSNDPASGASHTALAVLGISGWIGGEMSYRKHLGMVPHGAADETREREQHAIHSS